MEDIYNRMMNLAKCACVLPALGFSIWVLLNGETSLIFYLTAGICLAHMLTTARLP